MKVSKFDTREEYPLKMRKKTELRNKSEKGETLYYSGRAGLLAWPIAAGCTTIAFGEFVRTFAEFVRLLEAGEKFEDSWVVPALLAVTVFVGWLTKLFYDWTQQAALCTDQGLILLNDSKCRYRLIPWEELATVYELRNEKNQPFLVMSRKTLSVEQAKKWDRKSVCWFSLDQEVDGVVMLFGDYSKYYDAFVEELQSYTGAKFYRESSRDYPGPYIE